MSTAASSAAGRMAGAARAFIDSLEPEQQANAWTTFDTPDRREFTYFPGPRPGLALHEMTAAQQERAMDLLATGLSERGFATAHAIMQLEEILAGIERSVGKPRWERRHPQHYWFRVYGDPHRDQSWAWKVGGHHLAVQLTIVDDQIAGTPLFFGANPARVPDGWPQAGMRILDHEEDVARTLVAAFSPDQRATAVAAPMAPDDILTRHDPVADVSSVPAGLTAADMDEEQRELLTRLISRYIERSIPGVARRAWVDIEEAGMSGCRSGGQAPSSRAKATTTPC